MKQKVKNGINLLENVLLVSLKKKSKSIKNKEVYFDLKDSRIIPYYFFIIYAFIDNGYKVLLKFHPKFLAGFYRLDKDLLKLPELSLYTKLPEDDNILIVTDNKLLYNKDKRVVYLNPNSLIDQNLDSKHIPVPMHPSIYLSGKHQQVKNFRATKKQIRIFFSGNIAKAAYDNPSIRRKYKMPNRYEVISFLDSELTLDEVNVITKKSDWEKVNSGDFCNKLVMLKWEWSPTHSSNLDIRIKNEEWLPTLASSQFFLACPGVVTPQSHNVIEAMSVGAIPILSYKDLFFPALEHGKNCIYFTTEQELVQQIRMILSMSEAEIQEMSMNVKHYYDTYLTLDSTIRNIEEVRNNCRSIYFYNEVIS